MNGPNFRGGQGFTRAHLNLPSGPTQQDENTRLREALARIERILQPADCAENVETVGRAREIAIAALNQRGEP